MTQRRSLGRAQVHLDFHTPHHVETIGEHFDADEFADALAGAGADWVNLFAKCHHGWSYYPTLIGRVHPALKFDLLGEQIRSCRAAGLGIGVYYTLGWSAGDLEEHPEWAEVELGGSDHCINVESDAAPDDPRPPNSWVYLCPDGEYLDMMERQVVEIAQLYDPDGFWFDISAMKPCFCVRCRERMSEEHVDPGDAGAAEDFNLRRWQRALSAMRQSALTGDPQRWVFFNGTTIVHGNDHHVADATSGLSAFNTHQELEHLPTTWGGYDRLPLRARHYHALGFDLVAMSGRFHTDWGEFGGYKSLRALEYEARSMAANGARGCFGDQLHPCGRLDQQTYDLLGATYRRVRELWGLADGARPDSRLAVCLSRSEDDDWGLARAVLEAHREFVVVTPQELDPARHEAAVIAGYLPAAADEALARFASEGGRILAVGEAVADLSAATLSEVFGIDHVQRSTADGDYTSFAGSGLGSLGGTPIYNYEPGLQFVLAPGTEVLATIHDALFNRTYRQYFSHKNAPPELNPSAYPAVHRHGHHIVAAHPLGRLYLRHGAEVHRSLLWALLDRVDTQPVIKVSGLPPGGRVTVMYQPGRNRTLVHALYAPPTQRGRAAVIDDVVEVSGTSAVVRLSRSILTASDGLSGAPLPMARHGDGTVSLNLPTIRMHAVVVLHHPEK